MGFYYNDNPVHTLNRRAYLSTLLAGLNWGPIMTKYYTCQNTNFALIFIKFCSGIDASFY